MALKAHWSPRSTRRQSRCPRPPRQIPPAIARPAPFVNRQSESFTSRFPLAQGAKFATTEGGWILLGRVFFS